MSVHAVKIPVHIVLLMKMQTKYKHKISKQNSENANQIQAGSRLARGSEVAGGRTAVKEGRGRSRGLAASGVEGRGGPEGSR